MSNKLIETITSHDSGLRNLSIYDLLKGKDSFALLKEAESLESFRKSSSNLYHKVRATLFLFHIFRFHLQDSTDFDLTGLIPVKGVQAAFERDFEGAIEIYFNKADKNCALFSAIADAYYKLSFTYLFDQVKLSISHCSENTLLFTLNSLYDYPYRTPKELTTPDNNSGLYPVGVDSSPVRLDPSHSGWSDIFFLAMDFPEGARVINLSVDLKVSGTDSPVQPPCECFCRYIDEPVIHLISIDLKTSKKVFTTQELFDFGSDYLSLLKAGVVASGIVPPCFENSDILLKDILCKLLGKPGGIEITTRVNGIPKGSRLAVSTTLLSTIITRLMRFSGQIKNLVGILSEEDRKTVAVRAILGEWLGGSGGGWQDSGGLWPGIKVIKGELSEEGDPEYGVSRGRLMPSHRVFSKGDISEDAERSILKSLVLIHGGMSQDVGPILEMVTEKYLLKYEAEWEGRKKGISLFDKIVDALKAGNMRELGRLTSLDWEDSIQKVIPWVNNAFTEQLISRMKEDFKDNYWGFLMLGGMSGGGMAFVVNPDIREDFKAKASNVMKELKDIYSNSYPFIIDPVVYDFTLNRDGITAKLLKGTEAQSPEITHSHADTPYSPSDTHSKEDEINIQSEYGFDERTQDHLRSLLKKGEIGLAKNRLPATINLADPVHNDILHFENEVADRHYYDLGLRAIQNKEVSTVTFSGGMGSRWSHGAAVVKPVNPFIQIKGQYRSFIECHIAKSRKTGQLCGLNPGHVFTTSYLTHEIIEKYLKDFSYFNYEGPIHLSRSKSIAHRVYPMERDLKFYWEEQLQQKEEEHIQKVRDSIHNALIGWSKSMGEGEDYRGNNPLMRFNPPGHWYEVPGLLKNGTLSEMLKNNNNLQYLFCHNIDTVGANIDPFLLGMHISNKTCLTFEVTPRRIEDAGGGLSRLNGHLRLIEGLALPREEDEYKLSYYNTGSNWINIDLMLDFFGLKRNTVIDSSFDINKQKAVLDAIRKIEKRIPTYVTIKDVKHIWGSGQEDTYPVAQFEKLWGDMTGLKDLSVNYVSVSRKRGQQLKDPSSLDHWSNDGSLEYFKDKCIF